MSIKVEWDDVNTSSEEYYVYRATSPILDSALPVPLATVPAGTKFYLDKTTSRNVLYYYRIGSKVGADINLSANKVLAYVPYVGPGPQKIFRGDWNLGYFGRMGIGDLFAPEELQQTFNLGGGVYLPTGAGSTRYWMKFAYRGKVIYVPSHPLSINMTWQSLYMAGLVYGNAPEASWPAYPKTTYGVVPQGKVLTRGQDQFLFRMPASRLVPGSSGSTPADLIGGEYDQLIMAAYGTTINNFNPYRLDDMEAGGSTFTTDFSVPTGGSVITRGTTTLTQPDSQGLATASSTVSTIIGWRPIVELVQ